MNERRDKLRIIYDMLISIHEKGGRIKPTHLLYKSNLSHTKMQIYLTELFSKDMVREQFEKGNKFYIITKDGIKFLDDYRKIKEFTDSFGF
ncbi:hypothetical protein HYU23_01065 [Candidatus Woesearchaeota archaeon]|nr:hypothetical protein [Candidatus Woesearchaeota archaeon]